MEDNVIEIRGLWTQFGDMVVHRNIDLSVRRGEIMSLVGGSGSGKTTMLRQMLGLERPARGEVRIFGIDLHGKDTVGLRKLRERWGMLFQEGALFSALTVYENIALPLRELRVIDEELIHDLVMMKLDMVGIEPRHATKMPSDLSGGMVKRIALARALALEPELLFLDEPTAGLDPIIAAGFDDLVLSLKSLLGLTVVMVTHDLDSLWRITNRVAVLGNGTVLGVGTMQELSQSGDPVIREYFQGPRGRAATEQASWNSRGGAASADRPGA